jgi:hypothetical protein
MEVIVRTQTRLFGKVGFVASTSLTVDGSLMSVNWQSSQLR